MKKTLLILMAVALCTSLMAQLKVSTAAKETASCGTTMPVCIGSQFDATDVIPMLRNSPLIISNELFNIIGETYYNSTTNTCSRNTVSFRKNSNDAAAVWIMGQTSPNRGTGINYFDVNTNDWGVNPDPATGRIETERTGWGTHAFTEEGEVVVAHDTDGIGIVVNTRDAWGQGAWNQYTLKGPEYTCMGKPTTALLWPTMTANGNTVHLFCVTQQWTDTDGTGVKYMEDGYPDAKFGYKGYTTYPLYYRSLDGGKTWQNPVDLMDFGLTSYEAFKLSADSYVITAKGNHVVILIGSMLGFVIYFESFDNGTTWEKHTVFNLGEVMLFSYTEEVGPILLPQTAAVTIDDMDEVHVVFSTLCQHREAGGDGLSYYYALPTGMVYWNQSFEELNSEDFTAEFAPEGSGEEHVFHWESQPGYIPLPSVVGLPKYYIWNGGPTLDGTQFRGNGWTPYVRLIAKDDRVYVAYQSPLDYPFNFEIGGTPVFCRGIFVTVSEDNGASWDVQKNTSWITYSPDLVWADWSEYTEDYWPYLDENGDPVYYGNAIGIEFITENAFPSMSFNTKGDMFMLQWLYHHTTPFPGGTAGFEYNPISVFTFTQNLKNLPEYKNIGKIYKGLWEGTEPQINYPDLGCERPQNVKLSTCTSEDGTEFLGAKIKWDKPDYINVPLLSYNIYRDGEKIANVSSAITAPLVYFDADLEEGVTYIYQVSANFEGGGESTLTRAMTYMLGDNAIYCGDDGVKNIPAPSFKIYPNPANGNVWINIDANSVYTLTVTNIMGQVISTMNGNTPGVELNVSNYAPGVYIVNVRTANATISQKLIVK